MKTKEEIITEILENDCSEYMSLPEMLPNLGLTQFEVIDVLNIVEKRLKQAYHEGQKAGFESFRGKVEGGVKKLPHVSTLYGHYEVVTRNEVLTTIKEIKQ